MVRIEYQKLFLNMFMFIVVFSNVKERQHYVKDYVANVFPKNPNFKDNSEVIKDAFSY
ncbi:hypothetical protein PFDG_04585 [Plasmodium falciparum Dd2]|uniref:Uncharacterized protein n=1 Tax=Plasmodium falciparum (isolate Dd2) TaxID=57267 RepID=A0A0L7M5G6_PLAF4|nr:hypothetical protein PFDG_04585 [Plasmodium falciparum Dd2]